VADQSAISPFLGPKEKNSFAPLNFAEKAQLGTRKQGDVEISNFPISLRDGLVIDVSFVCEFKSSSRAPGGWNNGVRHSNDVLQARANGKNIKNKDVYGLVTRRLHLPS